MTRNADIVDPPTRRKFYSFSRSADGPVPPRPDGNRLLVWTDSALVHLKEAYRFDLTKDPPKLESVDAI